MASASACMPFIGRTMTVNALDRTILVELDEVASLESWLSTASVSNASA